MRNRNPVSLPSEAVPPHPAAAAAVVIATDPPLLRIRAAEVPIKAARQVPGIAAAIALHPADRHPKSLLSAANQLKARATLAAPPGQKGGKERRR